MKKDSVNYIVIVEAALKVFNLVVLIIIARELDKYSFGITQQIFLVIYVLMAFFSNSVPTGLSYFYGQYQDYRARRALYKRFFYSILIMMVFSSIAYLAAAGAFASWFDNPVLYSEKFVISVILFCMSSQVYFKNYSLITGSVKYYTYSMLTGLLVMIVMLAVLALGDLEIEQVLITYVIGFGFICASMLYKQLVNFKYNTKSRVLHVREVNYIIPIALVSLVSIVNEMIDQVMVSLMLSPDMMAELKVGSFKNPFIAVITGAVVTVLVPQFSKMISTENIGDILKLWKKVTERVVVLLLPMFVFSLVFAKDIIIFLFTDKYQMAPLIFQVYTAKYFFAVITFGAIMASIGLQKWWVVNLLIVLILNVILNYFAISSYGVLGAAIVTACVWYVGAYLQVRKINDRLGCKFTDYFPVIIYLKVLLVAVVGAGLIKILLANIDLSDYKILVVGAVYYMMVLLVFDKNIINPKQFKLIDMK